MMASIFFTERPPRHFQVSNHSLSRHCTRRNFGSIANPANSREILTIADHPQPLPQKQGLCQVVKASDFGFVIRLLTGKSQGSDHAIHDSEAYEIGKQVISYAIFRTYASFEERFASVTGE